MRKLISAAILGVCATAFGQEQPASQPAGMDSPEFTISEMKIENLQAITYLHSSQTATINTIQRTITGEVKKVMTAAKAGNVERQGPLLIIMHGFSPTQPFELQVGFKVETGTAAPEGLTVNELPAAKVAEVIYNGPFAQLRQAFERLFTSVTENGFTTGGDIRQYMLYVEGVDSPNNVVMTGMEVK